MTRTLFALAAVAALAGPALADGVTLEIETKRLVAAEPVPGMPAVPGPKPAERVWKQVVRAQGEKLNMDVPSDEDPTGKRSTAIFDGKLTVLDHRKREFEVLSEEKVRRLVDEMERARSRAGAGFPGGGPGASAKDVEASKERLREAIANLPPQTPPNVRKMMERQLETLEALSRPKAEEGRPRPYTFKNEGRTTIEGKSLIAYGVYDGERLVRRTYVAPLPEAGVAARARRAYVAYAAFVQRLHDLMPKDLPVLRPSLADEIQKVDGIPFITFVYGRDGEVVEEIRIKSAVAATHAGATFLTPATYRERDSFAPERGGGFPR